MNQKYLKSIIKYDPCTGLFTWLVTLGSRALEGNQVPNTARIIVICKKAYSKTNLAYIFMTGKPPSGYVYKTSKTTSDYRWESLYETKGKGSLLTQEILKSLVFYSKKEGTFTYSSGKKEGKVAGWLTPRGYLELSVRGRTYKAHSLAWFYITGKWPEGEIDHKDRDPGNNSWENLRDVSHFVNSCNVGVRANSSSGVTGVNYHKEKGVWIARISVKGNRVCLGNSSDFFEAVCLRKSEEYRQAKYYNSSFKTNQEK